VRATGKGCWVDASQVETGIYLTGTAVVDFSTNGRRWERYGNRSPYKAAAPHGIYRVAGEDRWIAIACFSDEEWASLVKVLGFSAWATETRFASLSGRLAHQDELDRLVDNSTAKWDAFELMRALQTASVPAGVCQTAEDRYEVDPQLEHLQWLVELNQTECGRWPAKESPAKLSETPAYMGGVVDRHGPNYAEDNEYVYRELLGLTRQEVLDLEHDGAI
jgi:crotonobetainyl-CoA:carnitine CoA-transferase CaiB-like acyl-CoA transferase